MSQHLATKLPMRNIYTRLLLMLASATHQMLARQVSYLLSENRILRSRLGPRVPLSERERNRLVRFGSKLGSALDHLVSIVHPDTLRRWIRESRGKRDAKPAKVGRKPTADFIRKLILKLARDTGWGYTRILGELRKLGIQSISRNTVKNILVANGLDTGPKRGVGTWDEFLKIHAATLWQADFLSVRFVTRKGIRDLFVLVFLHVESRRVFITPATQHPNEEWICEQAEAFARFARKEKIGAELVMHDRDAKFSAKFDATLKASGLGVQKSSFRSPNTMAFVERFIQTLKQECMSNFIVFGERHMNHLCSVFADYYHRLRPHQGKDNDLLVVKRKRQKKKPPAEEVISLAEVRCQQKLGGLLKHYYRKAA